jgi:hypothetical protein
MSLLTGAVHYKECKKFIEEELHDLENILFSYTNHNSIIEIQKKFESIKNYIAILKEKKDDEGNAVYTFSSNINTKTTRINNLINEYITKHKAGNLNSISRDEVNFYRGNSGMSYHPLNKVSSDVSENVIMSLGTSLVFDGNKFVITNLDNNKNISLPLGIEIKEETNGLHLRKRDHTIPEGETDEPGYYSHDINLSNNSSSIPNGLEFIDDATNDNLIIRKPNPNYVSTDSNSKQYLEIKMSWGSVK